ncbi:hypothetical protein GCM10011494_04770 [Novosphingobium endophyticum]|uniref:Uncharacterized protein n=1 Tax=Novosphingobium endophyticum TaxID=1955250 RepID=A0A916X321_9SPHN|nr:hypothetical protein [Novosphingobium endophyticum]GGB89462.1 hypothetical protein GCM10011494_04770 [Novosphingobium endophyticum]
MTPARFREIEVMDMAEKTSRKSGGNPPISRHPLFPAIVALWFGALFGLASVAISPALIEQAVLATGIDSLLPMAAPPLGATARILIALVMTASGGVIGALVARRIARPETAARPRRRGATAAAETAAPAPPAANAAGEEAPAQPLWKVRAMRESARETAILDIADFEIGSFDEADEESATAPLPTPPADEPARAEAPGAAKGSLFDAYSYEITARRDNGPESDDDRSDEDDETPQTPYAPPALSNDDEEIALEYDRVEDKDEGGDFTAGATPATEAAGAAERIASAELDALSQVELLERLALAMARCRSEAAYPAAVRVAEPPAEPEPEADHDVAAEAEPRECAQQVFEAPPVRLPRLSAVPDFDAPAPPEVTEPEPETAEAEAFEPVAQPPRMPAALRPVGHDSGEDAYEDALPGYIPPRHIGLAPAAPTGDLDQHAYGLDEGVDEDAYEDEESDVLEEGYSSLLNISRSVGPRSSLSPTDELGADESGADIGPSLPDEETHGTDRAESSAEGRRPFDAPDGQDPQETEKALRAALATLQRMSGAA